MRIDYILVSVGSMLFTVGVYLVAKAIAQRKNTEFKTVRLSTLKHNQELLIVRIHNLERKFREFTKQNAQHQESKSG